jgi:hypothetical protein
MPSGDENVLRDPLKKISPFEKQPKWEIGELVLYIYMYFVREKNYSLRYTTSGKDKTFTMRKEHPSTVEAKAKKKKRY